MTSKSKQYTEAFVWVWLPKQSLPVVAGRIFAEEDWLLFNYGKSYLNRKNAIPLYLPELPLRPGALIPSQGLKMPGCLRDASPDAWGRRVILNRKLKIKNQHADTILLDELTYLLESGSDRIGALDFQLSSKEYQARLSGNGTLEELLNSAERVEKGIPLSSQLDQALNHGSSIGGARPKALLEDKKKKYIAKFSSSSDLYNVVKAEFIAMRLAHLAGLKVAPVQLTRACKKDVLLIQRFDRIHSKKGWQRKIMVSALTLLGLDEMMARYASYEQLAEIIRHRFWEASKTLKELFSRLCFNILTGNTDDHARNHAAFWDGQKLSLTPAYDLCPQLRTGGEATQAMLIAGNNRMSRISSCLEAAPHFLLTKKAALELIEKQIISLSKHWASVCEEAKLNKANRQWLWGRQFLNPYAFEGLEGTEAKLKKLAQKFKF